MAAHNENNAIKNIDALIARIPKFSGSLNAGETAEARRDQFIRWRNGVVKVLNLKGYGELVPAEDLAEVGELTEEELAVALAGAEEAKTAEGGTTATRGGDTTTTMESTAARARRLNKMERPALAIISLSLQAPLTDWVDMMIATRQTFAQIWESLKKLYGVSGDMDEMSVMETFATMKLGAYQDPFKFYTSIISHSRQFEACGNTSLSTVARRVVAFMTKIPKAKDET
jgi:hypothetical protein